MYILYKPLSNNCTNVINENQPAFDSSLETCIVNKRDYKQWDPNNCETGGRHLDISYNIK